MMTYTDKRPLKPLERVSTEALMERLKRDFEEYAREKLRIIPLEPISEDAHEEEAIAATSQESSSSLNSPKPATAPLVVQYHKPTTSQAAAGVPPVIIPVLHIEPFPEPQR